MYKIIDLGCEFEQTGEPRARLLDTSLVKTASSEIQEYWSTLEPSSEFSYLWVIGVSAMEYYGCNNNGDAFHEADLKKTLPDWQEKANIFVHHVNKDPRKGIGKPVFAWYNEEMHRVELVLAIRKAAEGAAQIVARIKAGEQMYVSMGCNVAYDVCSICGHESKTRAEYCDHLKFNMKKIIPGGKQVYAINPNPHFFDISIVTRPADPTAFAIDKIASAGRVDVIEKTSAELGENAIALLRKSAAVRKMADIIKQVEGQVVDAKDDSVEPVRDLMEQGFDDFDYPEMPYDELDRIGTTPIGLLHALHHHGLHPTLDDAYWMSGLRDQGIGFGDALDHLPRLLEILGDNPEEFDPILEGAFHAPMEDDLRHALTMKVIEPVVVKRITIIARMPKMPHMHNMGKFAEFGYPDHVNTEKRNWAQMHVMDPYGHVVSTTPYYMRQAERHKPGIGAGAKNILGPALAMAALGSIAFGSDIPTKLMGGAAFGIPAIACLTPGRRYVQVNGGVEVPAETVDMAFKHRIEKTAAPLAPMIGMAVPALFALDYGVNKWKAHKEGLAEPNDPFHHAGKWVVDHPLAAGLGSALAGALLHHGSVGIWKNLNRK